MQDSPGSTDLQTKSNSLLWLAWHKDPFPRLPPRAPFIRRLATCIRNVCFPGFRGIIIQRIIDHPADRASPNEIAYSRLRQTTGWLCRALIRVDQQGAAITVRSAFGGLAPLGEAVNTRPHLDSASPSLHQRPFSVHDDDAHDLYRDSNRIIATLSSKPRGRRWQRPRLAPPSTPLERLAPCGIYDAYIYCIIFIAIYRHLYLLYNLHCYLSPPIAIRLSGYPRSLAMLFSRRNPQLLGALSALLFGGQIVQAIKLDLGDTGRKPCSA